MQTRQKSSGKDKQTAAKTADLPWVAPMAVLGVSSDPPRVTLGSFDELSNLPRAAGGTPPNNSESAVSVTFVCFDFGSTKRVSLSGDFNGWSAETTPMSRDQTGCWKATVPLSPGRYEYKFVLDGEWIPDPLALENVWNRHGTLNSVVEVRFE